MKKALIVIMMAGLLSVSAMVGCSTGSNKNNSSTPPPSSAPSSEAPKKAESGQLTNVYEKTIAAVFKDQAPGFTTINDATQLKDLTGVEVPSDVAKEFLYAMPMMNVQFQVFLGIEANEGKVADAEKILKDYQAKAIADKEAFPYVDFGVEKAKAAQVITVDNYVFYVCIANTYDDEVGTELSQEDVDAKVDEAAKAVKEALTLK